jgi:hypothetical protein
LSPNLYFDARAAWGQSDNSIDPLGVYTDNFSTDRSLVSAKLTRKRSFIGQNPYFPDQLMVFILYGTCWF